MHFKRDKKYLHNFMDGNDNFIYLSLLKQVESQGSTIISVVYSCDNHQHSPSLILAMGTTLLRFKLLILSYFQSDLIPFQLPTIKSQCYLPK